MRVLLLLIIKLHTRLLTLMTSFINNVDHKLEPERNENLINQLINQRKVSTTWRHRGKCLFSYIYTSKIIFLHEILLIQVSAIDELYSSIDITYYQSIDQSIDLSTYWLIDRLISISISQSVNRISSSKLRPLLSKKHYSRESYVKWFET